MCVDLFVMSMMPRALNVKFKSFINFIFNFYITYTSFPLAGNSGRSLPG